MRTYTASEYGRIVIIYLQKGEKFLESISAEIERLNIKNGVLISAIGSFRKVELHIITNTEDVSVNKYVTIEKPIELSSVQGLILNGEPHFHLVCSDPDRAYTGHLEMGCEVQYLAEIALMEVMDLNLHRKLDDLGIPYVTEI